MAITSFPFDGQETDENQFSLLFRELQDSGVADTHAGTSLSSAPSTGMDVQVQPGFALVRGFGFSSTAVETRTIPTSSSGTTIHRLVLRLDPATNAIGLDVVSGAEGGASPALNQTTYGIYEIPLAKITVAVGTSNLTAAMVVDDRDYLGARFGAWTTAKRPASPRKGRAGLNTTLGYAELWNGSTWAPVAPSTHRVGDMKLSALAAVEAGWLRCDGSEYANTEYPLLAGALGTLYGGTASTFRVPNLLDRTPVQAAPSGVKVLGASGGSNTVTLTTAQIPSHLHSMSHLHGNTETDGQHTHGHKFSETGGNNNSTIKTASGATAEVFEGAGGVTNSGSTHNHKVPFYSGNTGYAGGGNAVDITGPWLGLTYLIKAV